MWPNTSKTCWIDGSRFERFHSLVDADKCTIRKEGKSLHGNWPIIERSCYFNQFYYSYSHSTTIAFYVLTIVGYK